MEAIRNTAPRKTVPPEYAGSRSITPECAGSRSVTPEYAGSRSITPECAGSRQVTSECAGSRQVTPVRPNPPLHRPWSWAKRIMAAALALTLVVTITGCRRRVVDTENADIVIQTTLPTEPPTEPTQPPETDPPEDPTEPDPTEPSTEPTEPPEEPTEPISPTQPSNAPPATSPAAPTVPAVNPDGAETVPQGQIPGGNQPPEPTEPTQPTEPEPSRSLTVTLDPGRGQCEVETITVNVGQPFGALPPAGREGYFFTGWYPGRFGGTAVNADTIVTQEEDFTLYAHWSAQPTFTLNLDPNGGRLSLADRQRPLYTGSTLGTLPTPLRDGYEFAGWFTAAEGGEVMDGDTVYEGSSDLTLYAQWIYDPYAYWSFTLGNIRQQMYSCQELSVYVEFDADNVTVSYCSLLDKTKCQNAAQYREDMNVTDEWVQERNPAVILKLVSDMGSAADTYARMTARFPGRRVLVMSSSAVNGSDAQVLYYRLLFGKTLYPSWYEGVDLNAVGSELGVGGSIYGG